MNFNYEVFVSHMSRLDKENTINCCGAINSADLWHLMIDAIPAERKDHVRKRSECLDIDAHGHLKLGRP